ncbi:DNA repair protein rhp54 [Verticillium dahliae VDG2]|nr:DNA repair protein rhp54 [Verticillium dahliae VDG2]
MPTNELGNVLDLAITNISFVKTQIADYCYTPSDHYTLITTIHLGPHVGQEDANHPRPKLSAENYDKLSELVANTAWLLPDDMYSHTKIDEAINALDTFL